MLLEVGGERGGFGDKATISVADQVGLATTWERINVEGAPEKYEPIYEQQ